MLNNYVCMYNMLNNFDWPTVKYYLLVNIEVTIVYFDSLCFRIECNGDNGRVMQTDIAGQAYFVAEWPALVQVPNSCCFVDRGGHITNYEVIVLFLQVLPFCTYRIVNICFIDLMSSREWYKRAHMYRTQYVGARLHSSRMRRFYIIMPKSLV